jgi:hypothetical protein
MELKCHIQMQNHVTGSVSESLPNSTYELDEITLQPGITPNPRSIPYDDPVYEPHFTTGPLSNLIDAPACSNYRGCESWWRAYTCASFLAHVNDRGIRVRLAR